MAWLFVDEAAKLLNYVPRTVRNKAYKGDYTFQYTTSSAGRGGRKMQILLEDLPEQAQNAYYEQNGISKSENTSKQETTSYNGNKTEQAAVNSNCTFTKNQRNKGELRRSAVVQCERFIEEAISSGEKNLTDIKKDFVQIWNIEHPDFTISIQTLYRWMKEYQKKNPTSLNDRRGGYNRGTSNIPKQYKDYFLNLYLRETQPTVSSCYRLTAAFARNNGDGNCFPKEKAFRSLAENVPYKVLVLTREGEKAYQDKCVPNMLRSRMGLLPNDIWVSDHHRIDVFVRVPDGKGGWKEERPWLTSWMDERTRKIMAAIIRIEDPNSDIVLSCFGLGIEKFGIPKEIYMDNGKDYKAHDLFNSEKDKKMFQSSVAANLGINVHFAYPYNAQAKSIERFHYTLESDFGKQWPSYTGKDAKERPNNLKSLDIMEYPTLDLFREKLIEYIMEVYNESPHRGEGMDGRSPNKAYSELISKVNVRTMQGEEQYYCLMRHKDFRIVQKNGISYNNVLFNSVELQEYQKKKVYARYSPIEPDKLYVFDENDNFKCMALKVKLHDWNEGKEAYKEHAKKEKLVHQIVKNAYQKDNMFSSVGEVTRRSEMLAADMEKAPVPVAHKIELVHNEQAHEMRRKSSLSALDRNYEEETKKAEEREKKSSAEEKERKNKFWEKMFSITEDSKIS